MRAKVQAKWFKRTTVSRTTENKAVRKEKAGKGPKVEEENFCCAEEAYVKVLRAQRWVKSQHVKFRQGNNYRQRQKELSRHPRHGKRVRVLVFV